MLQTYKNKVAFIVSLFLLTFFTGPAVAETDPDSLSDLSVESFEKRQGPSSPRNPFAPGEGKEGLDIANLRLEGIIIGPSANFCLISGQVLKAAQLLDGILVKKINPGEVILKTVEGEFRLKMGSFIPGIQNQGSKFDIYFQNAELSDALKLIGAAGNFNIMIPDTVVGRVSVNFTQTDLLETMGSILRANGFEFAKENRIVRVGKPSEFSGDTYFQTQQINLKYANAESVKEALKPLLSDKGSVIADERTNSVSIKDRQSIISDLRSLVVGLDRKDQQVRIEAKILSATENFSRSIGIQWGFTKNTGQVQGFGGPSVGSFPGTGDATNINFPASNPTSGAGILIGNIFGNTDLRAQVTMAQERGDVSIISQPSVTTVNNVPAKIRSGLKIYVKSTSDISIGTTGGSSAGGTSSLEEIDTGIQLTVTPQITTTDTIKLKIEAEESEADFSRTVDGIPAVIDNTASTTVLVKNGETTVIGGLMKTKRAKTVRGVPILSSIPVLGWLFKSKTKSKDNNELLIFITPYLVATQRVVSSSRNTPKSVAQNERKTAVNESGYVEMEGVTPLDHEVIDSTAPKRTRHRMYTPKTRRR